jgi:FAD/FMN-containing dehydrogenase
VNEWPCPHAFAICTAVCTASLVREPGVGSALPASGHGGVAGFCWHAGALVCAGKDVSKSSSGYDLPHLLIGSEGTLATITELTVRLWPQPEATVAAVCTFRELRSLVQCATTVVQMGAPVARMEMLDDVTIRAVNAYCGTALVEEATLLFEFSGSEKGSKVPRCHCCSHLWRCPRTHSSAPLLWRAALLSSATQGCIGIKMLQ